MRGNPGEMVSFRIDPAISKVIENVKEKRGMDRTQVLCQGFLMGFRDDIIGIVGIEQYALWMSVATHKMSKNKETDIET